MIGMYVWGFRWVLGSHLFLEFGNPRLDIREPRDEIRTIGASQAVRWNLLKRRVMPIGQYQLLILSCQWTLDIDDARKANSGEDPGFWPKVFFFLEGQKLSRMEIDRKNRSCTLEFDLGAVLHMSPCPSMEPSDDQWSLKTGNGNYICYTNAGEIT